MAKMGKYLSLCLIVILVVSSLLMIKPVNAQTIPKPSVPQFTLKYVDQSYDVPTTTTSTTDPYNGKITTSTIPGYHVNNFIIELSIKNQQFPSTLNGNKSSLWYDVQSKGHFGGDWIDKYPLSTMSPTSLPWPTQSSSEYTLLSFPASYRVGDEIDFQVKAILGYQYSYDTYFYGQQSHILPLRVNDFIHEESNWSPTQTLIIPAISSSVTPTPSSTNSQPSTTPTLPPDRISDSTTILFLIVVATLVISVILLLVYVRHLKRSKPQN